MPGCCNSLIQFMSISCVVVVSLVPVTAAPAEKKDKTSAVSESDAGRGKDTSPVHGVTNNDNSDRYADGMPETNKINNGSPDTKNMQNHNVETQELAQLLHAYKQKRETDAGPVLTIDIPLQQCIDE